MSVTERANFPSKKDIMIGINNVPNELELRCKKFKFKANGLCDLLLCFSKLMEKSQTKYSKEEFRLNFGHYKTFLVNYINENKLMNENQLESLIQVINSQYELKIDNLSGNFKFLKTDLLPNKDKSNWEFSDMDISTILENIINPKIKVIQNPTETKNSPEILRLIESLNESLDGLESLIMYFINFNEDRSYSLKFYNSNIVDLNQILEETHKALSYFVKLKNLKYEVDKLQYDFKVINNFLNELLYNKHSLRSVGCDLKDNHIYNTITNNQRDEYTKSLIKQYFK